MLRLVCWRVAALVPILVIVSLATFSLILLIPGDPAVAALGQNATHAQVDAVHRELGLDRPVIAQYWTWVTHALQGQFGHSIFTGQPVSEAIGERFPVTLSLALAALVVAVIFSLIIGAASAIQRGRWLDRVLTAVSTVGIAVPNFWLAFLLILVFGLTLHLFPVVGYVPFFDNPIGWLTHIALPAITLAAPATAEGARQLRSSFTEILDRDYIRTARAKGLRSYSVLGKHALKNAAAPLATVIGARFAFMLGGSVVVEQIFGLPGIGQLAVSAVLNHDFPVIQGIILVTAIVVMFSNVLVEVLYGYFNPRLRPA